MIDISNRNICVFREYRSGSTGFTGALASTLDRKFKMIEDHSELVHDTSVLYNTHNFELLNHLDDLNPILLRCTRRNKTEQFFSSRAAFERGEGDDIDLLLNFTPTTTEEELIRFVDFTNRRFEVREFEVKQFVARHKYWNQLWDSVAPNFENQTFYYEDFSDVLDIPSLNLYNVKIDRDKFTTKFPEYKRKVYTNYDEVEKWMSKYYL